MNEPAIDSIRETVTMDVKTKQQKPDPTTAKKGRQKPGWVQFCEDVLCKLEDEQMKYLENFRNELDRKVEDAPILVWHFAITQDARNYLVLFMADAVFGFARHGESILEESRTREFKSFMEFVMEEEQRAFLQSESKKEYFASLNNRMMRLTQTVDYLKEDPKDPIPTSVLPADPVDTLFEYYPPEGQVAAPPPQKSPKETLKTMRERIATAKEDRENQEQLLSALEARKEYHVYLSGLEKRMERFVEIVKGITLQMLHGPDDGDSHVVWLFGRYLFFMAPPVSGKETAEEFLTLQNNLAQQLPRDEADAQACQQCPGFVPMVKEATCMPESMLSYIEQRCRQHGKRDEQDGAATQGQETTPAAADAEKATKPAGKSEETEGTSRSEAGASPKKPAESGPSPKKPAESGPSPKKPAESGPSPKKPAESGPSPKKPAESGPSPKKPAESGPSPKKPAETGPSPKKPAETGPSPKKPAESGPSPKKPAESGPSPKKPAESGPSPKKPAESGPSPKKPAESGPSPKKPAESGPSPKKPAEAAKSEQMKAGGKALDKLFAWKVQDAKPTAGSSPKSPRDEKGGAAPKGNKGKGTPPPSPGMFTSTSPSKLIREAGKYFIGVDELEGALKHGGGRYIFTIKSAQTVDYFCPVLGYLPLLPVLKVLSIKPEPKLHDPVRAKIKAKLDSLQSPPRS